MTACAAPILTFPASIDAREGRCDFCQRFRPVAHVKIDSATETWFLCRPCIEANHTDDEVRAAVAAQRERHDAFAREAPGLPYPELGAEAKDSLWCYRNRWPCAACGTEVLDYTRRSRKNGHAMYALCAIHWEDYPTTEAVDRLHAARAKRGVHRWGIGFEHALSAEPWRKRVQALLPAECLYEACKEPISVDPAALRRGMHYDYWVVIMLYIKGWQYADHGDRPCDLYPYPHAQKLCLLLKGLGFRTQIEPGCPGPAIVLAMDSPFFLGPTARKEADDAAG